jgi:hypothetical protein
MSDDKLQTAISKGARASRLLADPAFNDACAALEAEYISAWRQTPAKDDDARHRLWMAVNQLEKIKKHLKIIVDHGTISQEQLKQLAKGTK